MTPKVLVLFAVLATATAGVLPEVPIHEVPLDGVEVPYAPKVPMVDGTPHNPMEVQMPKFDHRLEEEVEHALKHVPYEVPLEHVRHPETVVPVDKVPHGLPGHPPFGFPAPEDVQGHVQKIKKLGHSWTHTVMSQDTYFPHA